MPLQFHLSWSIYVRCANIAKFHRTHLPAIEQRIGVPPTGCEIVREDDSPGEIRAVTFTNHETASREEAVSLALGKAGALYSGAWRINGLQTIGEGMELYLYCLANVPKPLSTPPALTTALLEVGTGWVERTDAGWTFNED